MAVKRKISDEVMTILKAGKVEGTVFFLPPDQLPRNLYVDVNKVLTDAGGKWDRKAKGHVFPDDPSEKLGLAIKTGVSVNEKNLYQEFFTPKDLARRLVNMANVYGQEVLEPSAGDGALAETLRAAGAHNVICVEIQEKHCKTLREKRFGYVINDDFLKLDPESYSWKPQGMPAYGRFKRVVMNPPFTKKQDIMGFMCSVLAGRVKKLEAQVSIVNKVVERTIWGGR